MENDSLNVDSASVLMPTPEQLGISIVAGFSGSSQNVSGGASLTANVGDTINFPVTVSWNEQGVALLVVPTNTATAKGLAQVGVSQESARTVKDGKEIASITFSYKIVVQDTGNLNIPVLMYKLPMSTGQSLTLRTESVALRSDMPISVLPFVVGFAVAIVLVVAGLWRARRRARAVAAKAAKSACENALREKMMTLKQRVSVADSRQWLLELESVCKEYAPGPFKVADNYDTSNATKLGKDCGDGKDWKPLLDEFAHARYGGGKRDAFENKETWKLAMQLLGVKEDE